MDIRRLRSSADASGQHSRFSSPPHVTHHTLNANETQCRCASKQPAHASAATVAAVCVCSTFTQAVARKRQRQRPRNLNIYFVCARRSASQHRAASASTVSEATIDDDDGMNRELVFIMLVAVVALFKYYAGVGSGAKLPGRSCRPRTRVSLNKTERKRVFRIERWSRSSCVPL